MKLSFNVLAPFLLFLIITVAFFYQTVFFGKIPLPTDLIVGGYYPWLDYKWGNEVGVAVKNGFLSDVVSVIYPLKSYAVDLIKQGQIPLWNSKMFAGYPLLANFQLGLLFPTMIFYLFLPTIWAWTFQVASQPFLACVFMFIFLRHLKLDKLSSIFGSTSYGFGGYLLTWLEWNVLGLTGAFLPLMLFATNKLIHEKNIKWGIFYSGVLCMQIFTGYPQVVVYTLLTAGLWTLFKGFSWINILKLFIFTLLGLGLSSVLLIPGFELFFNSQRTLEILGYDLAFLPYQNLIALIAPDFFGNPSTGNFWGAGNYTYISIYSGLVTLILAFVGFFLKPKNKIFLFALTLLGLAFLIMLENPISKFLYLSGLWGGTGATTIRAAFLINFSLSILAALTLNNLEKISWGILKSLSLFTLFVLLIFVTTYFISKSNFFDFSSNLKISTRNLILPITICLTILFTAFVFSKFNKTYLFKILMVVVLIVELFRYGWKFNTFSENKYLFPTTPVMDYLISKKDVRLVGLETIPANFWMLYGLSSMSGYDAVYPVNIAKYIAVLNSQNPLATTTRFGLIENTDNNLFNLTATENLVVLKKDGDKVAENGNIYQKYENGKYEKVFEDKSVAVLRNNQVVPRAYIIGKTISVEENAIFNKLLEKNFDYLKIAVISDPRNVINNEDFSKTPVFYQEVSNNHIKLSGNFTQNSFVVVTNTYYPGWEAYIDGQKTEILKTNYAFQGVTINKPAQTVDLLYNPFSFKLGLMLTAISSVIALLILLIPGKIIGLRFKNAT